MASFISALFLFLLQLHPYCSRIDWIWLSSTLIIGRTWMRGCSRHRSNWSCVPQTDLAVLKIARYGRSGTFWCCWRLDRGFSVDVWIEDLLLTPSWIMFIHRHVQVFVHVGVSFCEIGSDENRSSSHTCCALSLIHCVTVCAICISYILRFQSCRFVVKHSLLKKQNSRFVKIGSGPQHLLEMEFYRNLSVVSVLLGGGRF